MASAAREYRYAHREFSTNGSLARDLDWAVRERELEHAGEVPRHERTQAAPKVYHKEQVWCGSARRSPCYLCWG